MEDKFAENNFNIDETKNTAEEREINDNASNDRSCETGGEEVPSVLSHEEKANDIQEENSFAQKEDTCKEGADGSVEADGGSAGASGDGRVRSAEYVWNSNGGYSPEGTYHFKPENMKEYVGANGAYGSGYTVGTAGETVEDRKNKKEKRKKKTLLWLVPIAIVLALATGMAGGFFIREVFFTDEPDFYGKDVIEMTKNEAPVDVEVKIENISSKALSKIEVVDMVSDAVVEISTSSVITNSMFGNYVKSGAGSGVVFVQNDKYAYIVTNYHVIEGTSEITVITTDGTEFKAEYLDGDAEMDIAMLRIETDKEFPKIVCGSSSNMRVGEEVVAIGNPLGKLGGTVTDGIISALDRRVNIEGTTMVLMQTSAAVNPGNSGGGLFNMAGELIGIVNAKESATGVEGLGFAIPIDRIYDTLVEIVENKYIHGRPTLNIEIEYVSEIWEAIRKYGVNTTGVFVTNSNNESIYVNDIINSINGQLITDEASYAAAISDLEVGETVTVEVYRVSNDNRWYKQTIEVTVEEYVPSGIFG